MFRSLFQDHLHGSSFALSAPTTLQLHASSFVCIGMWSYALYLYVYPVYLPVCCLVVLCTTRQQYFTKRNTLSQNVIYSVIRILYVPSVHCSLRMIILD
jgi:hypothetical protein